MDNLLSAACLKRTTFSMRAVVLEIQRTKVGDLGLILGEHTMGLRDTVVPYVR